MGSIGKDKVKMNVRIRTELYERFRDKAAAECRTRNKIVERLVEKYVNEDYTLVKKRAKGGQ